APAPPGCERVLGRPRVAKGRVDVQACGAGGLRELRVIAREDRELVRRLERSAGECLIYRFDAANGRVRGATPWPAPDGDAARSWDAPPPKCRRPSDAAKVTTPRGAGESAQPPPLASRLRRAAASCSAGVGGGGIGRGGFARSTSFCFACQRC